MQPATGASSCEPCEAGQYQDGAGQEECLECATGSSSVDGSPTCVERDLMQCWKAKDLKSPRFTKLLDVPVDDELVAGGLIDVKKPAVVCLPADVAASGITDASAYQCCYKVRGDKLDTAVNVSTGDTIGGGLAIELRKRDLVCEPCTVTPEP